MTTSHLRNRLGRTRPHRLPLIYPTTLIGLGLLGCIVMVMVAWYGGYGPIVHLAQQLSLAQQHPPSWIQAPQRSLLALLWPTIALFGMVMAVMKLSPRPKVWSRVVIIGTLLVLTVRYFLWRSLSTLNFATPLAGFISVGLLGLEGLTLGATVLQLGLLLRSRDRRREADVWSEDVRAGRYTPSVDVLIPTYDEPEAILRRTIIGCQAMDYPHKRIYLLDDTRRPEMRALAQELGCDYLTRPDNRHAKAGNLNHAIAHTHGDLIVVFDADFVPTTNFLTRTIGFFQKSNIALVQTPQSFYNPDPLASNLRLEHHFTPEEEVFYRQVQPMRDGVNSVTCCGSSFVVRRSAIEPLGGFDTESIAEDYFTGVRLSALKYDVIYLNEKLSAGLAPENMGDYAVQRFRWAQGTLQALFISANPLLIPGLNWVQRLVHLEGLLHWFTNFARAAFLLMPLAYAFLGVIPIWAMPNELLYFFLPYYVVQMTTFAWLNDRARSALLSDVYSVVLCFPMVATVLQTLLRPFAKGFRVTPKGTESDRFRFNWLLAWPLVLLFGATLFSLWINLGRYWVNVFWIHYMEADVANAMKGYGLGSLWSAYNLVLIGLALLTLLDVPRPQSYPWFQLRRTVKLTLPSQLRSLPTLRPAVYAMAGSTAGSTTGSAFPTAMDEQAALWDTQISRESSLWGTTTLFSEVGLDLALNQPDALPPASLPLPVTVELLEESLALPAKLTHFSDRQGQTIAHLTFEPLTLTQQRAIVPLLFCRPGQWKRHATPGEWATLGLLLRTLVNVKAWFTQPEPRTISVSSDR